METLKTPTIDQMVKFIEDNQVMYWSQLDVELHYDSCETKIITGLPHALHNGVYRSQYPTKNIHEQIELVKSQFVQRNVPFTWWVSHRSTPKDLGENLIRQGFLHIGILPTMVTILKEDHASFEIPQDIRIKRVQSNDDLKTWGEVLADAYGINHDAIRTFCSFFPPLNETEYLQNYIAYYQDKPVSSGTLFCKGSSGGLYNIGVIPESRCKGLGTAMTKYLLAQAYRQQCKLIALQSYPIVVEACQRLGFKLICDYNVYLFNPLEA